jgi:hypothetical protein
MKALPIIIMIIKAMDKNRQKQLSRRSLQICFELSLSAHLIRRYGCSSVGFSGITEMFVDPQEYKRAKESESPLSLFFAYSAT